MQLNIIITANIKHCIDDKTDKGHLSNSYDTVEQ